MRLNEEEEASKNAAEKINALNKIFEDVISDASDLIKDLYWGVKNYLFFGLISILFGVSEIPAKAVTDPAQFPPAHAAA